MLFRLLWDPSSLIAQTIPSDAQATCTVEPTQFAGWFQTGTPALNGVVKPADSLDFSDPMNPPMNCPFYQWAEQMFLAITSPAGDCGGTTHVFDTPVFFDVSPPDAGGNRVFIRHTCSASGGVNRLLSLRSAQVGAHGLPVIFDKAGRMLEIEAPPAGPTGRPLVYSAAGASVEVQNITLGRDGKPVFLDRSGKPIAGARPIMRAPILPTLQKKSAIVQRFQAGSRPIFVDPFGNMVEVEQGQALDGGVLIAHSGSLVYYAITVNDVFAYFRTMTPNPPDGQPGSPFPTTLAELQQVENFAAMHDVTFPNPNALAMEVKSAWVEASTLPDPSNYITMTATIPTYDTTDPRRWKPLASKSAQLALVGMHVVGSTGTRGNPNGPGHPEMIWATFEHIGNTPLATYTYNSTAGVKTVDRSTAGAWLFSGSNSNGPFNCMHMRECSGGTNPPNECRNEAAGNIVPVPANPAFFPCPTGSFTPSDTLRQKAWGAASDVRPTPIVRDTTQANTEVISINNSVRGMIPAGDVRANYYFAGATWTIGGASPSTNNPPTAGNQVGTSLLANSTMETYQQGTDTTVVSFGSNCFSCHQDPFGASARNLATSDVSHIFRVLQPLSFARLAVRVIKIAVTAPKHTIRVTATNSDTGAPIAGATVTVSDNDGSEKASGITAADGTVTLTYLRCFEVVQPPGPPRPVVFTVPCVGDAQAAGLGSVEFDAP
jgi:hypothetical protein